MSQGMILGEVEYTAWRRQQADGAEQADAGWAEEGAPGAVPVKVSRRGRWAGGGGRRLEGGGVGWEVERDRDRDRERIWGWLL